MCQPHPLENFVLLCLRLWYHSESDTKEHKNSSGSIAFFKPKKNLNHNNLLYLVILLYKIIIL